MIITNDKGRPFLIRVVRHGDRWGLNDCLVHDKADPLIEFYDYNYANVKTFGERGQFVANYYASTLAEHAPDRGLCLHGGVDGWEVDAAALAPVIALAREETR